MNALGLALCIGIAWGAVIGILFGIWIAPRPAVRSVRCWFLDGHQIQTELIFSGGKNTHHDITSCNYCGYRTVEFSGTRAEWYAKHGLGEP